MRALGEVGVDVSRDSIPEATLVFQDSMAGPARDASSRDGVDVVVEGFFPPARIPATRAETESGIVTECVLGKGRPGGREMFPFPARALEPWRYLKHEARIRAEVSDRRLPVDCHVS